MGFYQENHQLFLTFFACPHECARDSPYRQPQDCRKIANVSNAPCHLDLPQMGIVGDGHRLRELLYRSSSTPRTVGGIVNIFYADFSIASCCRICGVPCFSPWLGLQRVWVFCLWLAFLNWLFRYICSMKWGWRMWVAPHIAASQYTASWLLSNFWDLGYSGPTPWD